MLLTYKSIGNLVLCQLIMLQGISRRQAEFLIVSLSAILLRLYSVRIAVFPYFTHERSAKFSRGVSLFEISLILQRKLRFWSLMLAFCAKFGSNSRQIPTFEDLQFEIFPSTQRNDLQRSVRLVKFKNLPKIKYCLESGLPSSRNFRE